MGAWIETAPSSSPDIKVWLLPIWEHGLKQKFMGEQDKPGELLPIWEHGLKLR